MAENYRFIGKTSKETFVIKGINVFSEKWRHAGGCATVTNPQNGRSYVFSKYLCGDVEFVAGKDANGYWLFFVKNSDVHTNVF
ncbi:MAG: hypothetical protein UHD05_06420 [Ruminococcus sp.]|nr:hypothetical protein [Ruminococcus sp.]